MTMSKRSYTLIAWFAVAWTFFVVLLGAWVRLHDAGLGCPDWPGCFGQVAWPVAADEIAAAAQQFPDVRVDSDKAAKEMIHRYPAGIILILSLILTIGAWIRKKSDLSQPLKLPMVITVLVVIQALFGMWTVTFKLMPIVVTGHLLGGFATLSLLFVLAMRMSRSSSNTSDTLTKNNVKPLKKTCVIALILLTGQIFLGGWTSTNYAALACPDFPSCQGQVIPQMNFDDAFTLFREIGVDYEGGILDFDTRVAIHMVHRMGALLISIYFLAMALYLMYARLTRYGVLILVALVSQLTLGVLNVTQSLPLPVAVAHNGGAALLLLITIATLLRVWQSGRLNDQHI